MRLEQQEQILMYALKTQTLTVAESIYAAPLRNVNYFCPCVAVALLNVSVSGKFTKT